MSSSYELTSATAGHAATAADADPFVPEEEHHLSFTDCLRWAFASKGFLRTDRQEEWLQHGFTRDELADATDWLAGVEHERVDF